MSEDCHNSDNAPRKWDGNGRPLGDSVNLSHISHYREEWKPGLRPTYGYEHPRDYDTLRLTKADIQFLKAVGIDCER